MRRYSVFALAAAMLALAPHAQADVTISSKPTRNMDCGTGSVCKATSKNAVLNATDLANLLASSNVEVTTGEKDAGIDVEAALSWTSASKLSLITHGAIAIDQPISVLGAGGLALSAQAQLGPSGRVIFWDLGGRLRIGKEHYALVGSVAQLASAVSQNPDGFYALANDYDATPDGTYAAAPVATFDGIFDGLGNTISNLTINDPNSSDQYVGLFSQVLANDNPRAALRDLTLQNVSVTANRQSQYAGGLVGLNWGKTENIRITGAVTGGMYVGGIAGDSIGGVSRSSTDVSITAPNAEVGGLVGVVEGGGIDNSSSSGPINSGNAIGGLVGQSDAGVRIVASHSSSTITANGGIAGGLVAYGGGPIIRCYATGNITGTTYAGGLVAFNSEDIVQSFATGSITGGSGDSLGGGLVTENSGTITQSYSRGDVTTNETSGGFAGNTDKVVEVYSTGHVSPGTLHGGFVGFLAAGKRQVRSAYWDVDTSGFTKGTGNANNVRSIVGLTTDQFKAGLPDGFDPAVWGQDPSINDGYPYLLALPPPPPAPHRR